MTNDRVGVGQFFRRVGTDKIYLLCHVDTKAAAVGLISLESGRLYEPAVQVYDPECLTTLELRQLNVLSTTWEMLDSSRVSIQIDRGKPVKLLKYFYNYDPEKGVEPGTKLHLVDSPYTAAPGGSKEDHYMLVAVDKKVILVSLNTGGTLRGSIPYINNSDRESLRLTVKEIKTLFNQFRDPSEGFPMKWRILY